MSHEIEISEFEQAFASREVPAWHGLGTVFEGDVTTSEMLKLANLNDWDVHLEQVTVPGIDSDRFANEAFAVVRTNPFDAGKDVLGIVGKRYHPFQNEELLAFGEEVLHGGGRWETAGSIRKGTQVFASLSYGRDIVLDPNGSNDKIENYLLLNTSHNGTIAVQASNTPVRVVCANTLNFALRSVKQSFKVRHTQTTAGKVQAAREALGLHVQYIDEFEKAAQAMIQTQMTKDQFTEIVTDLYPKPEKEKKGAVTRWENKVDSLQTIFAGQDDNGSNENILGTAWSGLNALTEYSQWYRTPRGGNAEATFAAGSGFDAMANAERSRQYNRVMAFVAG